MFGKTREEQRRQVIDLATRAWGQQVFVARVRAPEISWRVAGLNELGRPELARKPHPMCTAGKILLWVVLGVFLLAVVVVVAVLLDGADPGSGGSNSGSGGTGGGCLELPDLPKRHRITVCGQHENCAAVPFGRSLAKHGHRRQNDLWMVWSDIRVGFAHINDGDASFLRESPSGLHPQLNRHRPLLTWSWPDGSSARVRFTRAERRRARKQAI